MPEGLSSPVSLIMINTASVLFWKKRQSGYGRTSTLKITRTTTPNTRRVISTGIAGATRSAATRSTTQVATTTSRLRWISFMLG